ncbi:MAG: ROK family transcriptional regulator, partial [Bacteroidota bacterium]
MDSFWNHQGGNPERMRAHNRALVLHLIRMNQPISRVDLMRETGLTRGAISKITAALIEARLVREIQHGESTGGRRPTLLKLDAEQNLTGVIDVRPKLTTLAVVTLDGHIIRRVTIRTEAHQPTLFLVRCARQVGDMLAQFRGRTVLGIGLVVPGYPTANGAGLRPQEELGWVACALDAVREAVTMPLWVVHQGHAVAAAEQYFGLGREAASFVSVLWQSDTLSVGCVEDGRLLTGANGRGGDVRHLVIDTQGTRDGSGLRGTVGHWFSGHGLVERLSPPSRQAPTVSLAPVTNLEAVVQPGAVHLSWSDPSADAGSASNGQIAVFRHTATPVPTDALHGLGFSASGRFVDVTTEVDGPLYYVAARVGPDGQHGPVTEPVAVTPAPPVLLFDDRFDTPANADASDNAVPEAYTVEAETPPVATPDGLRLGTDGDESTDGDEDARTWLWRNSEASALFTATVRPITSGAYDTCGLLFKYGGPHQWYCAALAYGHDLVSRQTLSLIRQGTNSTPDLRDEWLGFYEMAIEPGRDYVIQVRVEAGWIRAKAWLASDPEPAAWQLVVRDDATWDGTGVGIRCFGQTALVRQLQGQALPPLGTETSPSVLFDRTSSSVQAALTRADGGDADAQAALLDLGEALGATLLNLYAVWGIERVAYGGLLLDRGWRWIERGMQAAIPEAHPLRQAEHVTPSSLG